MILPTVVHLSKRGFWDASLNVTAVQRTHLVMTQLTLMTVWCRISTLEFPGVMLSTLDGFPGVLCAALTHLDLSGNWIDDAGAEKLAGVLGKCTALAHLDLHDSQICDTVAEKLAEVVG
jgi:hypothetical protein